MVLGTWPTPSATLLPRKRTANQFPGDPHTARVKKVLVISSESEDVHMNCPHVRSEIFAPHADEKGNYPMGRRTVGLPRSNFDCRFGTLELFADWWNARCSARPSCGPLGVRLSSGGKATLYKAIGASEFFNKSDFHDGPVHAYLLLRMGESIRRKLAEQ